MKKLIAAALLLLGAPALALAANDKIDPNDYVCAELLTNETVLQGGMPIFEALQIDGYVSADLGMDVVSPDAVNIILGQSLAWCEDRPVNKVAEVWWQMRSTGPTPEGDWNARTTTCAQYAENQEDGSGFIVWLDGFNRRDQNTQKSILNSDDDVQAFIDACLRSPDRTMLEVLREHAK